MGHDMTAAAAMGQLRSVLQSYAWQGSAPAVVLDQLVQGLDIAQLATCRYGTPDGAVRLLAIDPGLLVGAALGTTREEAQEPLVPGSVLVLYTDGLVEHRGRLIDEGLEALAAALRTAPDGDAEAICEHLLAELAYGELDDDVALLVVRVLA